MRSVPSVAAAYGYARSGAEAYGAVAAMAEDDPKLLRAQVERLKTRVASLEHTTVVLAEKLVAAEEDRTHHKMLAELQQAACRDLAKQFDEATRRADALVDARDQCEQERREAEDDTEVFRDHVTRLISACGVLLTGVSPDSYQAAVSEAAEFAAKAALAFRDEEQIATSAARRRRSRRRSKKK